MKKTKTKHYKEIVVAILFLVVVVSLISAFGLAEKIFDKLNESSGSLYYTDEGKAQFYYGGELYSLNENVESVLIMGIDSIITSDNSKTDSLQADFIALLVIDKLDHSFRLLHINRDTMTEITQIDENGNKYGTYEAQLALAHTYGGDGKQQCRNTVTAVKNLLYNASIDHYISFTMDAVPIINDIVGGVTVVLEDDIPSIGDEFVKGAEITLTGEQALAFVRYRSDAVTTSNLERMERQRQYITALSKQYISAELDNTLETFADVSEYVVSNCTANQLSVLMERLQEYTYNGTLSLEGEAQKTGEYVEYYIDEAAAQKTVVDLFYKIEE